MKPYLFLLEEDNGQPLVNYSKVTGHREHYINTLILYDWIKSQGLGFLLRSAHKESMNRIRKYLSSINWTKQHDGEWAVTSNAEWIPIPRKLKNSLIEYKKEYWKKGIIHHDDVLFFSDKILDLKPNLGAFLSARYPYIFIDEFQDTNPVQTRIVEIIGRSNSIIGVIGDLEQSIYGFQGAQPSQFEHFSLRGQRDYKIEGNRIHPRLLPNLNSLFF